MVKVIFFDMKLKLKSSSRLTCSSSFFVFIFISVLVLLNCQVSNGGSSTTSEEVSRRRIPRQLGGLGGFGGFGASLLASLQPPPSQAQQPYNRRQQNPEVNFFNTMMNLNFDMTEVIAMYRNVTAVAVTPGCLGHCRTPMALWVVQSFYPCYNMKKADCPKGLVCCMEDLSSRIASPNSIHDSRIKLSSPSLASAMRDRDRDRDHVHTSPAVQDSTAQGSISSAKSELKPTSSGPTESTTLFDEEYFKNNFIQDEIPE